MARTSGVVLLAAGTSQRFGSSRPKQFLSLNGQPLYQKSLRVFLTSPLVREIVIVARREKMKGIFAGVKKIAGSHRVRVVEGGKIRGESVRNGFKALSPSVKVVLIHDAARPMVDHNLIYRVEKAARRTGVSLAAWPLPDTLKRARGIRVEKTIPRKNLWVAQTPQAFRYDIAKKCLLNPLATATDDVELAERRGYPVELVEGSPTNFKITYQHDLIVCRKLLRS